MMKTILKKKLSARGYPLADKHYPTAHKEANTAEKRRFPKGYEHLKKEVRKLHKGELMGKNTRSGKIEVESRYRKDAKEIAYHERTEHKNLQRLDKKSKTR